MKEGIGGFTLSESKLRSVSSLTDEVKELKGMLDYGKKNAYSD